MTSCGVRRINLQKVLSFLIKLPSSIDPSTAEGERNSEPPSIEYMIQFLHILNFASPDNLDCSRSTPVYCPQSSSCLHTVQPSHGQRQPCCWYPGFPFMIFRISFLDFNFLILPGRKQLLINFAENQFLYFVAD